jgi:hypothetical protein
VTEDEIMDAIRRSTKDDIRTLFAADTVLKRMGFPKEAQNLRGIAAIAIMLSSRQLDN